MAADDIQTIPTAQSVTTDALAAPGTGVAVGHDTLQRWTRAVTEPRVSDDPKADDPSATTTPDTHQREPHERPSGFGRFDAALPGRSHTGTTQRALPSPAPKELGDSISFLQTWVVSAPPLTGAVVAQHTNHDVSMERTPFVEPSLAPERPTGAAMALGAPVGAQATAMPAAQQWAAALGSNLQSTAMSAVNDGGVPNAEPSSSNDNNGRAVSSSVNLQTERGQTDGDTTRALPLTALRDLHTKHRHQRLESTWPDSLDGKEPTSAANPLNVTTELWVSRVQAPVSVDAGVNADGVAAVDGKQQLHALIESCCSRLWVNDGGGRTPQGVLLDLGRWMPGCTVEVAKAAGVLSITLRGVDGAERARLEDELQGLGEGLADKLGCKVVAAVATNKELT
jgi:hypothetical protein